MNRLASLIHQLAEFPTKVGVPMWLSIAIYLAVFSFFLLTKNKPKKMKFSNTDVLHIWTALECMILSADYTVGMTDEAINGRKHLLLELEEKTYNELKSSDFDHAPETFREQAVFMKRMLESILEKFQDLPESREFEIELVEDELLVLRNGLMSVLRISKFITLQKEGYAEQQFTEWSAHDFMAPYRPHWRGDSKKWFEGHNQAIQSILESLTPYIQL